MLDQNTFMETIREVGEIIRTSEKTMSREDILSYFKSMELNEAQENMVLEFLLQNHEDSEEETKDSSEEMGEQSSDEKVQLPDSRAFQMYYEEIQGLPVISKETMEDFYEDLLDGDTEAIQKISEGWMMRILDQVRSLSITEEDFSDVIQEGNMALFLKLSEICGSREIIDLDLVLEECVLSAMKSFIQELTGEDEIEHTMIGKATLVHEARKYLMEENGQEPSVTELADYTHISLEELEEILEIIQKAEEK